tara:strand:- start:40 stop:288 length:249 start_codon:yes stop_codon:yes gene_type:complete
MAFIAAVMLAAGEEEQSTQLAGMATIRRVTRDASGIQVGKSIISVPMAGQLSQISDRRWREVALVRSDILLQVISGRSLPSP